MGLLSNLGKSTLQDIGSFFFGGRFESGAAGRRLARKATIAGGALFGMASLFGKHTSGGSDDEDDFDENELDEDEFDEDDLEINDFDENDVKPVTKRSNITRKQHNLAAVKKENSSGMRLMKMQCQSCGAQLEIDLDHLQAFCPYCGQKLMMDFDQVGQVLAEKEKTTRHINTEEQKTRRLQMQYEDKENERKSSNKTTTFVLIFCLVLILLGFGMPNLFFNSTEKKQAKQVTELQTIEAEVEAAILKEDYDTALIKANQLRLTAVYSRDEEKAWDAKREAYIAMIQEKVREKELKDPNNIFVAMSSEDLKGKDCQEVIEQFKSLGFTNVTSQVSPEKPGLFDKSGTVEHVLVGGKASFTVEDYFAKDTPVIVYYYSK